MKKRQRPRIKNVIVKETVNIENEGIVTLSTRSGDDGSTSGDSGDTGNNNNNSDDNQNGRPKPPMPPGSAINPPKEEEKDNSDKN